MKYQEILSEGAVPFISPQVAKDNNMFGPLYHGTRFDINDILASGFNIKKSVPRTITRMNRPLETSNGMAFEVYSHGIAAPIHFLGFANYFTTVKAIGKMYNGDSVKNLKEFYYDSQRILEINYGAPNTMMKWWLANGYDLTVEETRNKDVKAWIRATGNLTRNLRKQYDAVWYKGKGMRKLLDGDQVAIYNSKLIYCVNKSLATGLEIGAKVYHNGINKFQGRNDLYMDDIQPTDFGSAGKLGSGWKGIYRSVDHNGNDISRQGGLPIHFIPPKNMEGVITNARLNTHSNKMMYDVKWKKGGERYNYFGDELIPASDLK